MIHRITIKLQLTGKSRLISNLLVRKQVVRVNGSESSEALMLHGVPQGNILGPLFFILFINDPPLYTSAQLDLYAVDTTVTASAYVKNIIK